MAARIRSGVIGCGAERVVGVCVFPSLGGVIELLGWQVGIGELSYVLFLSICFPGGSPLLVLGVVRTNAYRIHKSSTSLYIHM